MITSFIFTKGYGCDLPLCKDRTFRFADGVNVLFGENGTGKSTILRTIAEYGLTRGGWSSVNWFSDEVSTGGKFDPEKARRRIAHDAIRNDAKLDLDSLTFMYTGKTVDPDTDLANVGLGFGVGRAITDLAWKVCETPSSGQEAAHRVNNSLETLSWQFSIPSADIGVMELLDDHTNAGRKNPRLAEGALMSAEFYRRHRSGERMVVLLDEPEEHLSLLRTVKLYNETLPALAEYYQVIVASHSPFALMCNGMNVVSMDDEYTARCRGEIGKLAAGFSGI